MKKLLRLPIPLLLLCLCACGGDSTDDPDPQPNPPAPPVEDKITFPDDKLPAPLFSDTGGEAEISFTASGPWTAAVSDVTEESGATGAKSTPCGTGAWDRTVGTGTRGSAGETGAWSPADTANGPGTTARNANAANSPGTTVQNGPSRAAQTWLSVSPASGDAGAATVVLTALPNDSDEERTALVTLASGTAKQTLTVTQTLRGALVAAPGSITVDNAGGEISIEVTRNVDFDVEIDAGWITRIGTRALETETLVFHIAENTGYDYRMGTITFTSKDGTLTQEVKVTQDGTARKEEAEVREYLVKLYEDTDGADWTNNTNWCSDKPLGEWYGVRYRNGMLELALGSNNLDGAINISNCKALVYLDCSDNRLMKLAVSGCGSLVNLFCNNNLLADLDARECKRLAYLDCSQNELIRMKLSDCVALTRIDCYEQKLISLDVSGCMSLMDLYCFGNRLTELNVSGCSALRNLHCNNNELTVLDLANKINLVGVACNDNSIHNLNVAGCRMLSRLDCSNNRLSAFNVSGFKNLAELYCHNNKMKTLNVTGCGSLSSLNCNNNKLTVLKMEGCISLSYFECQNNRLVCEVPAWFKSLDLKRFDHDIYYVYTYIWDTTTNKYIYVWDKNEYGWWYPNEPLSGHHGW